MTTMVREQEERGHSARYLILIFLACVATCAVFFSMGFMVGYNERFSSSTPKTEVVTAPTVIPPTVIPPAESAQVTPPVAPAGQTNPAPDAGVTPPATKGPAGTASAPQPVTPASPAAKAPASPQPAAAATPGEVGEGITLQVAALRTKQDAEALVGILKGRGYPVFLVAPEYAHADDNLFRVQVGPFKTRDDAEKVRAKLAQEGFKPFIRH